MSTELIIVIWIAVGAAIVTVLTLSKPSFVQSTESWLATTIDRTFPRPWTPTMFAFAVLLIGALIFAEIAIHEIGHVVGG